LNKSFQRTRRLRLGCGAKVSGGVPLNFLVGPRDTMTAISQDAQRMSLMLQYGLVSGVEVVRWADSQIVALDSPPESLIGLSTTPPSQIADLLSHLRALASGADFWAAFREILGSLHDHVASKPTEAEHFANELYRTAVWFAPGDVPKDLSFVHRFDDAFSLARGGTYGQTEDVLRDFLSELERFKREVQPGAAPNGGPATQLGNSGVAEGPPSVN
jgi:hypothetical protein